MNLSPTYRQLLTHAAGWSSRPDARPAYWTSGEHSNVCLRRFRRDPSKLPTKSADSNLAGLK